MDTDGESIGFGYPDSSNAVNRRIREVTGTVSYLAVQTQNRGSAQVAVQASWLRREPWSAGSGPARLTHSCSSRSCATTCRRQMGFPSSLHARQLRQNRGVGLHADQRVVRIEVIDVLARDDLVLHEHGRRHRPAAQDLERQPDHARRRTARGSSRPTRSAACAARAAPRARPARRSGRRSRRCRARPASWNARAAPSALGSLAAPTRMRVARVSRRCLRTRSSDVLNWPSPSIETTGQLGRRRAASSRTPATTPRTRAARQRAGARELEQQDLVGLAAPVLLRPARQLASGEQARLVVVRAEVGRARMRDVDGDHRDARLGVAPRRSPARPPRRSGTRSRDPRLPGSAAPRSSARPSAGSGCRRRSARPARARRRGPGRCGPRGRTSCPAPGRRSRCGISCGGESRRSDDSGCSRPSR